MRCIGRASGRRSVGRRSGTPHEGQDWKLGGNPRKRFGPQTVVRKRTLLSLIQSWNRENQWEERVRSYQSRVPERISDDVRSGILTDMCFAKIKTHIHLNLSRLPDNAALRSETAMIPISAVSVGRKVCAALVYSEAIRPRSVPNAAKVMMARQSTRSAG